MRTRDKWRVTSRSRSLEEIATALAYICWQIALEQTKNLHREDFDFAGDEQRTGVIAEYLCFLVHVTDRLVFRTLDGESRLNFIATLARQCGRHYQRNLEDVHGRGRDYLTTFIDHLNTRAAEYAEYSFEPGAPGYHMLRGLGRHIQDVMGEGQTNRWVIDQIMEIDGPAAVLELRKGMDNLMGSAELMTRFSAPD
jgi:hypothetical protein